MLLALLLTGSMWFYVQKVLAPHQRTEAAIHGWPRGNLSDLYPRWLGARELLLHHRDPYSAEITREIQIGYYGRPLDPSRADDPKDQQRFAYPVYVVFLMAPTIQMPFPAAQTVFKWVFVLLTLLSIPLWLRVVSWRPTLSVVAILTILTFGSFAVVQGIKLQQLSLVVNGIMAASAAALVTGYFSLAGFLLALATFKPQLALPMAAWLMLWAVSDWRRRQKFVWSFVLTMAALLAASEYVLPGWMGRFREALSAYREYTQGASSVLEVLLTPLPGRILVADDCAGDGRRRLASASSASRFRRIRRDDGSGPLRDGRDRSQLCALQPGLAVAGNLFDRKFMAKSLEQELAYSRRVRLGRAGSLLALAGLLRAVVALRWRCRRLPFNRAGRWPLRNSLGLPVVVLGLLALATGSRLSGILHSRQREAQTPSKP